MYDIQRNCEHCRFYVEHKSGVLFGDGLCTIVMSNPRPVRKWFRDCKEFIRKEDYYNGTAFNI